MRDFNKEAAVWDTPPRVKIAQDVAAAIMRSVTLKPSMDVLDFGCGTGLVSQVIRPKVRSLTGADTSRGMLEQFEAKLTGCRAVLLEPGRETQISGMYDLIVSSLTLHHVPKIEPLFAAFYSALKPGGLVALCDLDFEGGQFHDNPDGVFHQGFHRAEVEKLLKAAGFSDVRTEDAAAMTKPAVNGQMRTFTIFLLSGQRST